MRARTRKLIGTVLLVALIPLYSLVVMAIASPLIGTASTLVQSLFFLVTGIVWVLPAAALVTWMIRGSFRLRG
jgi:hypothetical protein